MIDIPKTGTGTGTGTKTRTRTKVGSEKRILKLCKTCTNVDRDGNGVYCKLTSKSCRVEPSSMFDGCINYRNKVIAALLSNHSRRNFTGKGR